MREIRQVRKEENRLIKNGLIGLVLGDRLVRVMGVILGILSGG
jgi:hypothetical protein